MNDSKCKSCNLTFRSDTSLVIHMQSKHNNRNLIEYSDDYKYFVSVPDNAAKKSLKCLYPGCSGSGNTKNGSSHFS